MGPIEFTITKCFLQPLPALLLVPGARVANLRRRRKESRRRLLGLVTASTPAVVDPLAGTREWRFPPAQRRPTGADAIVVLGGGILEPDRTRRHPDLSIDTLQRCHHAAELYHRGPPCPVIVTGGILDAGSSVPPVAPARHDLLVRLGVNETDVVLESNAGTTYENAAETRKLLRARGLGKVVLVTEMAVVHEWLGLAWYWASGKI